MDRNAKQLSGRPMSLARVWQLGQRPKPIGMGRKNGTGNAMRPQTRPRTARRNSNPPSVLSGARLTRASGLAERVQLARSQGAVDRARRKRNGPDAKQSRYGLGDHQCSQRLDRARELSLTGDVPITNAAGAIGIPGSRPRAELERFTARRQRRRATLVGLEVAIQ